MRVSLIAAMSNAGVIGFQNTIPWKAPGEQKRFKQITQGHPIIMGRKTYESIGRPLPNRRNIVITRQKNLSIPGCEVVASLADAFALVEGADEVFVIGGANIWQQTLDIAKRIYLTVVNVECEGDAYFPDFAKENYQLLSKEHVPSSPDYTCYLYERI